MCVVKFTQVSALCIWFMIGKRKIQLYNKAFLFYTFRTKQTVVIKRFSSKAQNINV